VKFKLKVRTKGVKLGWIIPEAALREQLDALQKLQYTETELSQLRGMTVDQANGTKRALFSIDFTEGLKRRDLTEYELVYLPSGEIELTFYGPWLSVMNWETAAMAIISELYYWHLWQRKGISSAEFSAFYAELYQRLVQDAELLRQYPGLTFAQFGHRRRHSRMWEVIAQETFDELLPGQCVAPSNVWLAFKTGQNNPKGTNAHELPMVWATLHGNSDEWVKRSPYDVVERWNKFYPELAILLPDTFRTTAFFQGASSELASQTKGVRIDSKVEEDAIPEVVDWFRGNGVDPLTRAVIPSDGLTPNRMVELWQKFSGQVGLLTFGWGTGATNNVNGILPKESGFHTLSMVIKVVEANGLPTVKLSDNPQKHTGDDESEIARYDRLFAKGGEVDRATVV
jgi:nicotinate phosphoribosyltransferase